MKKCINCGKPVHNNDHDYCYECWQDLEDDDASLKLEDHFEFSLLDKEIPAVYIMFYGDDKEKIGYTKNLDSRIIEIKRKYPDNELVYFREFVTEAEARRFEAWLKTLSKRDLISFIASFQDKIKKVKRLI